MAYFEDLSEYSYRRFACRPGTKNIGWLGPDHEYDRGKSTHDVLDSLWEHCAISVAESRGIHECELCSPRRTVHARRNGVTLLLGTSEIRVFSHSGTIFAAPTLIFHYVRTHRYRPPDEFLRALMEETNPLCSDYFDKLTGLNLEWKRTSSPVEHGSFRFIRVDGKVQRVEAERQVYLDES